jgi:hypothetical protein
MNSFRKNKDDYLAEKIQRLEELFHSSKGKIA